MPDGRLPEPGGWNRFVVEVDDLVSRVAEMKRAGLRFRNGNTVSAGECIEFAAGLRVVDAATRDDQRPFRRT